MDFSLWWYGFASVTAVSAASLVGVVALSLSSQFLHRIIFLLVSLAVGALFGDVFLHLIPELFEEAGVTDAGLYILLGLLLFFILEKFLRWSHVHDLEAHEGAHTSLHVGYLNIVSDGLHNFIDGVFIGVSYLVSIPVGLATTAAVLLHEIPQELGDFGVLIHAGFSKSKALLLNFLSALLAIAGFLVAFAAGDRIEQFIPFVLGVTAGTFIYLAGSDLVPELHKVSGPWRSLIQLVAIMCGIGAMYVLLLLE